MNTVIISAFPATGKTHFFNNHASDLKVLDSDSSEFSWIKDKNGKNTKERNPNFPKNYIEHIKLNIGKVDIIFVSSHETVREELVKNNIHFLLFYPNYSDVSANAYIDRFINRGDNENFIKLISDKWFDFISSCDNQKGCVKIKMNSNQYLSDFISLVA